MAGRQFNRLRKQLGEDLPPAPASEEGSESEEEAGSPAPAPFNPFDLLTDEEVRVPCPLFPCLITPSLARR